MGRYIEENVKRRLYAESMGRCMNPACQCELFRPNGDVIEKAHIDAYCETADNSYDNLVLLCPTCHTDFDKNRLFSAEEVLSWKQIRRDQLEKLFSKKLSSFAKLQEEVAPLLLDNKAIFENYYLTGNKDLWDKFEPRILSNNKTLKALLAANMDLIQRHSEKAYSNLACVQLFIAHIDEFEATRLDDEKHRAILFPAQINSIFGIAPVEDSFLPSTESIELLMEKLKREGRLNAIELGIPHPYILMNDERGMPTQLFLDDTPRLRQMYHNYHCFRGATVRFESLNYAMRFIRSRKVKFQFLHDTNIREIMINDTKLLFIYDYCLSQAEVMRLSPEENSVVVNLHNWNGTSCISRQAYAQAERMNVTLLTMDDFYEYINSLTE